VPAGLLGSGRWVEAAPGWDGLKFNTPRYDVKRSAQVRVTGWNQLE
jgi:hypothetical protein